MIRGIDVDADSVQGRLEGFFRARVKHFVANAAGIGVPRDKHQFAGRSSIIGSEIKIDQTVTAVIIRKIRTKVVIGFALLTRLLGHDRLLILDLVDNVLQLLSLSKFERIERGSDFVGDYYSS